MGRTREAADLEQAVARSRLTMVTGPGGVGKTRLALEIARRRCGRGLPILVVDLGVIGQADQVPIAVAHALGLTQTGPDPTTDVVRALADTRGLVVVDICEHVASAAAALIGALLQGCPKLKVLATSRQHLPMTGARIVTLGPLTLDEAVALFVERAQAVRTDAVLDTEAVAEIDVDMLGILISHSLVHVLVQPDGELRYRILDTLRSFAREYLDKLAIDEQELQGRHLRFLTSLA